MKREEREKIKRRESEEKDKEKIKRRAKEEKEKSKRVASSGSFRSSSIIRRRARWHTW